jgi:hypothetical protein
MPISPMLAGGAWQFAAMTLGVILVSILPGRMMLALEKADPPWLIFRSTTER